MKLEFKKKTDIDKYLMALNPKYYQVYAFVLTFFIYVLSLSFLGSLRNGIFRISTADLHDQIIPIIYSLRSVLRGEHSPWYSWNILLGSGTVGTYAYYTLSPFNVLYYVLGNELVETATALVIILKASFAAMTFQIFISRVVKKLYYETVLISVMYGLNGMVICYYHAVLLMDAVLIFPIIILGIVELIKNEKIKLLLFGYSYLIGVQFYMGYVAGVSSFVLFVLYYLYNYRSIKYKFKTLIKYFICVLTAIGVTAVIWMPALYQIISIGDFTNVYDTEFSCNFLMLINNMFIGQYQSMDGFVPYVYCGTVSIIALPVFFTNRHIARRKRIFIGIALLVFICFMLITPLNYMLHGFDVPNMVGYRYSFVFSFIVLLALTFEYPYICGQKCIGYRYFVIFSIIYLIIFWICRYTFIQRIGELYDSSKWYAFILGLMFIICWYMALGMYKRKNIDWLTIRAIISMLVVAEMILNIFVCLKDHTGMVVYVADYFENAEHNTIRKIKEESINDNNIRTIYIDSYRPDIAIFNDMSSLSYFSSVMNSKLINCLKDFGYDYTANYVSGNGWTPVTASLFGIDYIIDGKDVCTDDENVPVMIAVNDHYYQNYVRNSRVLPLAFTVDKKILTYKATESPFENQNVLISCMIGENVDCFKKTDMKMNTSNARIEEGSDGINIRNLNYPNDDAYVSFVTTNNINLPVYANLYNDKNLTRSTKAISLVSNYESYMSKTYGATLYPSQIFSVPVDESGFGGFVMTLPKDVECVNYRKGYFVYYDKDIFASAFEQLNNNGMEIYSFGDGYVKGKVLCNNNCVLFTSIPYEKGWEISVDGNPADIIPVVEDTFIGAQLNAGEHEIVLKYYPPLLNVGIIVSLITLVCLLCICLYFNIHKKNKMIHIHT